MKIITTLSQKRWTEYRDLRVQALEDVPQAFLDEPDQAKSLEAKEWQRKMKNMTFAEMDDKLVGMIGAYQDEKKKLQHVVNVVSFYVIPNYRNQGVGKALLQAVIYKYKDNPSIKKLQLGVTTTQKPAQHLYMSLGFKQVGKLKYAVKVGNKYFHEYLMELYLR